MLGRAAGVVADLNRRVPAKQGHRALLGPKAALDVQRLPGALLLVLAHTEGELGGMTEGRFADFLRLAPPILRIIRRIARPMVALARKP